MDLVYTVYKYGGVGSGRPPPSADASVCTISSQNVIAFTASLQTDLNDPAHVKGVYCADLNNPWEYNLVCASSGAVTSIAWDRSGTKLCIGDEAGNISIWRMGNLSLSEWTEVFTTSLANESIIKTEFISSSRGVRFNYDRRESNLFSDKFNCGPEREGMACSEVCLAITNTSLLFGVCLNPSSMTDTVCLGRGRNLISCADIGIHTSGDVLLAVCGADTPVVVHRLECSSSPHLGLQIKVHNHSSFTVSTVGSPCPTTTPQLASTSSSPEIRVTAIKFVLTDSCDAIIVGVDSEDGGKLKMWELVTSLQSCHKIFGPSIHSPKRKKVCSWRWTAEFNSGSKGAKLCSFTTPRTCVVGGSKPACYIVAAFSDGSMQCLIRDSLQQIASVELPRSGTLMPPPTVIKSGADDNSSNYRCGVIVGDMSFTSTGTGLVVSDSQGQMYVYRMSPIADPGGPHVAAFLVTLYEYCLVSGHDWWDLALASAQTNVQNVIDKLESSYNNQPVGMKNFCYNRFMSIKASLYRLLPHGEYKAGDTMAMQTLNSIRADFTALLGVDSSANLMDKSPVDKFESIVRNMSSNVTLDSVVSNVISSGISRDLSATSEEIQNLISLGHWVLVLALHILSAKPEFKNRRGPGFWILQEGGLQIIREIIVLLRLWNFPRSAINSREKDLDLNAKVYNMVSKLREKPEDESLLDECLILPSLVIIPDLDILVSTTGVLSQLTAGISFPYSFYYGIEPNLPAPSQHAFLEGLTYTQDFSSNIIFDSIGKRVLGKCPVIRSCNRCRSFTKVPPAPKEDSSPNWESRWTKSCHCGGSWSLVIQ